MLRRTLTQIRDLISQLDEAQANKAKADAEFESSGEARSPLTPKIQSFIETLINEDLQKLDDPTQRVLESKHGYIDYYSPEAESQLKFEQTTLKKYVENLEILQATFLCIHQKRKALETLRSQREKSDDDQQTIKTLEEGITQLLSGNINLMNPQLKDELQHIINEINRVDMAQKTLKLNEKKINEIEAVNSSKDRAKKRLLNENISLQQQIDAFNSKTPNDPEYKKLDVRRKAVQRNLDYNTKLITKISEGMLDVKRALYILVTKTKLPEVIRKKEEEKNNLTNANDIARLDNEITSLQKKYDSIQLTTSPKENKRLFEKFDELKELMSMSIKDYQELVMKGSEYNAHLHLTTAFYWQNLYLYRINVSAIHHYLTSLKKGNALAKEGLFILKCIDSALKEIPSMKIIANNLKNVRSVAEHHLVTREKTYNNNKPKEERPDDNVTRFYNHSVCEIMEKLFQEKKEEEKNGFFFFPYNPHQYVLDHPAETDLADTLGNCHGEAMVFLIKINAPKPTINNICPERELINYQLDQFRPFSASFPPETLATVTSPKNGTKLTWDDIKAPILESPTSTQYGDLCIIRFSGSIKGYDAPVGHRVALIKIKDPNPYKYVVYDYNFGPFGFQNEEQLEIYFKTLFKYYCRYTGFELSKQGELSESGYDFINSIEPVAQPDLTKPHDPQTYQRIYWNTHRLISLAKYASNEPSNDPDMNLNLLFERLNDPEIKLATRDKISIFNALLENKLFKFNQLLALSISHQNPDLLQFLLAQPTCTPALLKTKDFLFSELLLPAIRQGNEKLVKIILKNDKIENWDFILENINPLIKNKNIDIINACRLFKSNPILLQTIIKSVYSSIKNESRRLEILKEAGEQTVIGLLNAKDISPSDACKAFTHHAGVIKAAYHIDPESIQLADPRIIIKLINEDFIRPIDACQSIAAQTNHQIMKTAYDKAIGTEKIDLLQTLGPKTTLLLVSGGHVGPIHACKAFNQDEDVIKIGYDKAKGKMKIAVLKEANPAAILDLIKEDLISPLDACEAFNQDTVVIKTAYDKADAQTKHLILQSTNHEIRLKLIDESAPKAIEVQKADEPLTLTPLIDGVSKVLTDLEDVIEPTPKITEPTSHAPVTPPPNALILLAMDNAIKDSKEIFKSLKLIVARNVYSENATPENLKNFINIASKERKNKYFGLFDFTASYAHTASAKGFYRSLQGKSDEAVIARNEICTAFGKPINSLPAPTAFNQTEFATVVTAESLPTLSPTATGKKD